MKINKAEFSCMLKKVRDQVLKASNIVQAFSASGMRPLSFVASYAYKQVPPPSSVVAADEEWIDSNIGEDDVEQLFHSSDTITSTTLMSSKSAPEQQRSSHSASQSQSQTTSHSSTPGPQSSQVHTERLKDINTWLAMLAIDATPRRVANLCKDVLEATCWDAAHNMSTATLVNIVKLQSQVIKRQHTQHILDDQLHGHLKMQLTNKGWSQEQTGGVLKHGYGALDSHALDVLEEEAAMKRAEAADKEQQREEASEERQRKRNEAAAARVIRAAETEQHKIVRAAEQEWKATVKAAKVAKKAARAAVIAARGRGHGRGHGAGAVQGHGQGCGCGR